MDEISQECFDEGRVKAFADMVKAGLVSSTQLLSRGIATAEEVAQVEELLKQRKQEKAN